MKKKIIALFLLSTIIVLQGADNDKASLSARSEWMGGFAKLEAAEQAFKANAPAALGMYREALEVFESVRRKYPQWNPSLLNYRINYCQQKIGELERKLESQANTLSNEELLELTKSQARKLKELEAQKDELDVRVKFLSDALLRAREEAAKSSSLENTATSLATARANLERKVSEMEVRLKDYEKKIAQLMSDNSEAVKLRKEFDKAKQRAERAEETLRVTNAEMQNSEREKEKLKQTLELLTKHKNELDALLKATKELADTRANELADAKRSIKVQEERVVAKEKLVASRDEELVRIKKQLDAQQAENEELKRLRKSDSAVMDEFRKGKASAAAVESDNKRMKTELDRLNERYNAMAAELKERETEMENIRKALEKERANGVLKDEKNAELVGEVSQLRNKNHLAENANLKLSMELKEAKILQEKTNSDIKSANGRIRKAEEQEKEFTDTQARLKTQIELSKKQEEQLADQKKELAKKDKDNKEVQAKLNESLRLSTKLQTRISMLEKQLGAMKDNGDNAKKILVYEKELAELRDKNAKLQDSIVTFRKESADKEREFNESTQRQKNASEKALTEKDKELKKSKEASEKALAEKDKELKRTKEASEKALAEKEKEYKAAIINKEKEINEIRNRLEAASAKENANKELKEITKRLEEATAKETVKETAAKSENEKLRKQIAKLESNTTELEKKKAELERSVIEKERNAAELEKSKTELESSKDALEKDKVELERDKAELEKNQAELKDKIEKQQNELVKLKRDSDEATAAIAKNKELENQLLFVMNELGIKNKNIEQNEKLAAEREAFYKQQLKERDEMLNSYKNSTENNVWLEKIKALNAKIETESKRRMALEATLVDLQTKLEDYTEAEAAKTKHETEAKNDVSSTAAQEADFRISRERERKKMVANYLKQGSDSELQNKPEAAMFNYQKALELDSDNVIALQRLGIIAARQGNDRDTVKYLKQAFRFDTDNIDTLLALGFAQARLGEASWAVAYLGRAVALSPDNAYAAKIYGSALFNLGWTQAAETQLKTAYKLDPQSPEAPYNLAVLYATAEKPDFKEAAKWYKIAIANGAQRDPGLDATLK